jgi:hypothetical protein
MAMTSVLFYLAAVLLGLAHTALSCTIVHRPANKCAGTAQVAQSLR